MNFNITTVRNTADLNDSLAEVGSSTRVQRAGRENVHVAAIGSL